MFPIERRHCRPPTTNRFPRYLTARWLPLLQSFAHHSFLQSCHQMPHRPITSFSGILFIAGVLLVLAFASASGQDTAPPGNQPLSSDNIAEEDEGSIGREAKLLAYFSTTTLTSIATTTQFKLSTCVSTSNAACAGRRKRRMIFTPKDSSVRWDLPRWFGGWYSWTSDFRNFFVRRTEG